jgi:preprotein translocase subunit SecA
VGKNGQISHDLEALLAREEQRDEAATIRILGGLTRGTVMRFDKNHRQVKQAFIRFSYFFHAAHALEGLDPLDITAEVLEHLEDAQASMRIAWGQSEFTLRSQNASSLADFGPAAEVLGAERADVSPMSLTSEEREILMDALGIQKLNEIYRYVLSRAISDLWVEYLTQIESLRISIGLEAYGQRDPLVQYKSKASEMFKELLADIRMGVVNRMFTYQPRKMTTTAPDGAENAPEVVEEHAALDKSGQSSSKKKRRRH